MFYTTAAVGDRKRRWNKVYMSELNPAQAPAVQSKDDQQNTTFSSPSLCSFQNKTLIYEQSNIQQV